MPVPVSQAEVVSNPGGTGTTLAFTLPSHQEDDILIVQGGWSGNQAPITLTGWNLWFSQATGTAANGCGQGVWWRRVGVGETVSNPTLTIGTTAVTRIGIAYCIRGADIDNPANTFWQKQQTVGNSTSPTPPGITTLAPNYLLLHMVTCRGNSAITHPSGYTEEQDAASGTTLAVNGSTKTQTTAATVSGQAATISSNRWVAAIIAIPSPDYPYFRSQTSQTATSTSVTGTLPTGTTAADLYGRKDLIIATVEAAGTAPSPNTPADWTSIATWETTTSGGATTVRQYWALYDGSINLQFNRTGSGEISLNLSTYRNPHQTAPIGNVNVRQNASSTTSTWDALTRSHTKSTVAAMCVADGTPTYTAPAGWTEREDGLGMTCADQIFEAGGSTASASFTLSTASPTAAGLVEILSHAGVAAVSDLPLTASDSVANLSDDLSRIGGQLKSFSDSAATFTDALTAVIEYRLSLSDNASTLADSAIQALGLLSTLTDTLAELTDSQTQALGYVFVLADSFTLTDDVSLTLGLHLALADQPDLDEFPATAVLDDFNRANGGLGSNWGGQIFSGDGSLTIDTNRVKGSTLNNNSQGWVTQFGADCEVYIELTSTGSGDGTHLMARVNALNTATPDCYAVSAYGGGGNIVGVYRYDNGALHVFDEITQQISNGDWLGLRIIGPTLTVYYKDISVSPEWVEIGEFIDSTYSAGGYIGLLMETTGGRADNFGGGTVVGGLGDALTYQIESSGVLTLELSDALSFDDALSLGYGLLSADVLTSPTDSLTLGYGLLVNDAADLSDAEVVILGQLIDLSEALALADSALLDKGQLIQFDDSFVLVDSTQLGHGLLADDVLSLNDSHQTELGHALNFDDSLTLADNEARTLGYHESLSDVLALSDTQAGELGQLLALSDNADTLNDLSTLLLAHLLAFSEPLTLNDAHAALLAYLLTLDDDADSLIDDVQTSALQGPLREVGVTDSIDQLADAVALQLGYLLVTADVVSLLDSPALSQGVHLTLADNAANWADSAAFTYGLALILNDNAALLADVLAALLTHALEVSDSFSLTDTAATSGESFLRVDDALTLADDVDVELRGPDRDVVIVDVLVLTDAISVTLSNELQYQIVLTDTITLYDHYFDLRGPYIPSAKRHVVVPSRARTTRVPAGERETVPAGSRTTKVP